MNRSAVAATDASIEKDLLATDWIIMNMQNTIEIEGRVKIKTETMVSYIRKKL